MKPLKGYKNVTSLLIREKCCKDGCPRDADVPMDYDEESGAWYNWYCVEHFMKELNRQRRRENEEG